MDAQQADQANPRQNYKKCKTLAPVNISKHAEACSCAAGVSFGCAKACLDRRLTGCLCLALAHTAPVLAGQPAWSVVAGTAWPGWCRA